MTMTWDERRAEEEYKSPPEAKTVTYCEDCGNEVYEDETLYLWGGRWICPECLEDDLHHMPAWELAEELELERRVVA